MTIFALSISSQKRIIFGLKKIINFSFIYNMLCEEAFI